MIALRLIKEALSICKVPDYTLVDLEKPYCFTGCTPDEKSLVCRTEDVPANASSRDDGWTAFRIEGILACIPISKLGFELSKIIFRQ